MLQQLMGTVKRGRPSLQFKLTTSFFFKPILLEFQVKILFCEKVRRDAFATLNFKKKGKLNYYFSVQSTHFIDKLMPRENALTQFIDSVMVELELNL